MCRPQTGLSPVKALSNSTTVSQLRLIFPAKLISGNGTIDFVPPLSITAGVFLSRFRVITLITPIALEFREWLGGEDKINGYCHDMAVRGGAHLAATFGTRVLDETGEFTLNMVLLCQ